MIHDILLSLISADTDPLPILEFTVSKIYINISLLTDEIIFP